MDFGESTKVRVCLANFFFFTLFLIHLVFVVDHILFLQKDVKLDINKNEVCATQYMSQAQLKDFIAGAKTNNIQLTPWFALIADKFLWKWWDNLNNLQSQTDNKVHHM